MILALALATAQPAAAQTPAPESDLALVARLLGAIWRPLPATGPGAPRTTFESACGEAVEEMDALNAQLPADVTPEATRAVRAPRGFVIVNAAEPGEAFLFPNAELTAIASGPARFVITDRAQGRIDLTDAAGHVTQLQLGVAGGKALMRILRVGAPPLTYVGCAATG